MGLTPTHAGHLQSQGFTFATTLLVLLSKHAMEAKLNARDKGDLTHDPHFLCILFC